MKNTDELLIDVDFREINSHKDLVQAISPIFNLPLKSNVHFNVNLNTSNILYSDYLLLLASSILHLRSIGINVKGAFIGLDRASNKMKYASRINFFDLIGFDFKEDFVRRDATGRFTEIIFFNDANSIKVFRKLMKVISKDEVNQDMLVVLHYCLWEVLDNTIRHSKSDGTMSNGSGYVCVQYFPIKKEIRLMICDNGQGIHSALTSHPQSEFRNFSERESVLKCIEKGVTNSTGRGFGLWATSKLVKENKGSLIIHSGNYQLLINNREEVINTSNWNGTYTFLRLNTNVSVNYDVIFENDGPKDSYKEFNEELFGNINQLW